MPELQLPAILIDDWSEDTSTVRPALVNRQPDPGRVDVLPDLIFSLDIVDPAASGIDLSATEIYVAGVLAFDGGVFQTGFGGSSSSLTSPGAGSPDGLRITVSRDAPYDSEQVVTVRVVSETNDAVPLDTTYTYTIADVEPPRLVTARSESPESIRLTFNEPMDFDTLAVDQITITPENVPPQAAVEGEFTAGSVISDTEIALTVDAAGGTGPLTPSAPYRVTIAGLEDAAGNEIVAPNNTATFTTAPLPIPSNRRFSIYNMLAAINRREDVTQDLLKLTNALQDGLDTTLLSVDRWAEIFDVDLAPESWLDLMLLDLGNPFPFALDVTAKRKLARLLVPLYQQKGTVAGIVNALRLLLGIEAQVATFLFEGWLLGESELGIDTVLAPSTTFERFSFNLVVDRAITAAEEQAIRIIVDAVKPAPTHLVDILEPGEAEFLDHWEMGFSELGVNTLLH